MTETMFESVFSAMNEGVVILNGNAEITAVNPAAERMLGLAAAELIGRSSSAVASAVKLIHEDGSECSWDNHPAVIVSRAGQPLREAVLGICRPDGALAWLAVSMRPLLSDGATAPYSVASIFRDITERKRMEGALADREGELRALAESSPGMMGSFYLRPDGSVCMPYVSAKIWELFGLTPQAVAIDASPLLALQHPDDAQMVLDSIAESARTLTVWHVEYRILHPAKGVRWMESHTTPQPHPDGGVIWYGYVHDITERKQAELKLQAHARSLECMDRINKAIQRATDLDRMMRDVLDIVHSCFDCDRVFLTYPCDPDATEWWVPMERTKPEYPGALALGMVVPMNEEVAMTQRILLEADGPVQFGPGTGYPLPADVAERFGIKSFMSLVLYPKQGKPWQFGIHQCSHAKVWTEDEAALLQKIGQRLSDALTGLLMYRDLQASEQNFRSLAENMPDTLIRYDREGRRTYINPALKRISAVRDEQMIGLTQQESNPFAMPKIYRLALEHTLATGERSEFELPISTPSGDIRTNLVSIVAERSTDGQISGAITIGHDITERKRAEQQLRELAAHLQTAREEEKAHLARELHDDLGQILFLLKMKVSGYAHDCAENSGASCKQLQEAQTLTDRAIGTARNIVSALRPPALDYGIAAALKWLVENFVANISIQCELQIEDEEIRLDESKSLALFRIVQEALNNVVKHAQADRVEIVLNKDAVDYVMRVRDNGTGFDTNKNKKGSFGLIGMQERTLMHGGTVSIESRSGGGTEIVVRIPAG
jgi:PAS domain S-box-containing protein